MRVAWPSTSSPVSAARYLAASFLLLASPSHAAPRQPFVAFASQQAHRVAGSNNSNSKRRLWSSTSSTAVRTGCAAATAMGSNDTGGSGSGIEMALSLPKFLESCSSTARKLQQQSTAHFHVFSGNEACDADSMCSAICMAFLRKSAAATASADGGDVVYVPGTSHTLRFYYVHRCGGYIDRHEASGTADSVPIRVNTLSTRCLLINLFCMGV